MCKNALVLTMTRHLIKVFVPISNYNSESPLAVMVFYFSLLGSLEKKHAVRMLFQIIFSICNTQQAELARVQSITTWFESSCRMSRNKSDVRIYIPGIILYYQYFQMLT